MIRDFESHNSKNTEADGATLQRDRRGSSLHVPIFAVSASLFEKDRDTYITTGFDGWIMKPIDFQQIGELLKGVRDDSARRRSAYEPGMWERGGWFGFG